MYVIYPLLNWSYVSRYEERTKIFLAGTCTGVNWRASVVDGIKTNVDNSDVVVVDPYRNDWPDTEVI